VYQWKFANLRLFLDNNPMSIVEFSMNEAMRNLKSRLRGTWIHHAAWAFKNPRPKAQGPNDNIRNAIYNRQTVEVMFRVLRQNSNCIDAGAHEGSILRHMIDISPGGGTTRSSHCHILHNNWARNFHRPSFISWHLATKAANLSFYLSKMIRATAACAAASMIGLTLRSLSFAFA
jgi:hypothetical protein